jgi:hypothetical protein
MVAHWHLGIELIFPYIIIKTFASARSGQVWSEGHSDVGGSNYYNDVMFLKAFDALS